jgi:hypothetical protein
MNSFLENRPIAARKEGTIAPLRGQPGFQSLIPQDTAVKTNPEKKSAPQAETAASPQIELVQNGGKVDRIIVTCTCCNRIELKCQY